MKLVTLSIPVLLLLLSLGAAPAQAQTFPASWAGVWEFTTDDEVCGGAFIETYVDTSSICPDEDFGGVEEGITMSCSGTITDTALDVTCSGSLEIFADCTMTITLETQGTRTGDSISGTERTTISYTGSACGLLEDDCTDGTISGVRLNPDPGSCASTPTLPTTWGTLKAIYR